MTGFCKRGLLALISQQRERLHHLRSISEPDTLLSTAIASA
jgi:hypothetical protein